MATHLENRRINYYNKLQLLIIEAVSFFSIEQITLPIIVNLIFIHIHISIMVSQTRFLYVNTIPYKNII